MCDENNVKTEPRAVLLKSLAALLVMALIAGLMVYGYLRTLVPVTLLIDGAAYSIYTHQVVVQDVLRDVGLVIYPEDLVMPALDERIEAGDIIQVKIARPVRVEVDGKIITGRSLKHSVLEILADLGVRVSPHDKITVSNGSAHKSSAPAGLRFLQNLSHIQPPSKPPLQVTVYRAVPITINLDGQIRTTYSTAPSVGEALREAGILLYEADRVQPELAAPIQADMVITVKSAIPLTILADGQQLHTRTHAATVADALAEANIALTGQDYARPALDSALTPNMEIQVVRVYETFAIEQEPVPYEVVWMPDPDMEIDTRSLRQSGEEGVLQKRFRVRYENGQEVSRNLEDAGVIRPPKNKIITYGTKIVIRTLETADGVIEYWRRIPMLATSYSASTAGTPRTASYYGRTALGWTMRHGIVAVDPRVVRLGSQVYVPGYGIGAAGDTGGAIKYRRIDLGYDDDNLVLWYRWVDVYLLTPAPPPDTINYIIPDWPPRP